MNDLDIELASQIEVVLNAEELSTLEQMFAEVFKKESE